MVDVRQRDTPLGWEVRARLSSKINWRQAIAEVGLLMLGVLLALWVDSAVDSRQELAEEQQYLVALIEDFEENRDALAAHIRAASLTRDADLALLQTPVDAHPVETIRTLLGNAFLIQQFEPVMATYQDMVNSGDIRLLRNDILRVSLARFEGQARLQAETSRWAWDHWVRFEEPLLIEARALAGSTATYRSMDMPATEFDIDLARLSRPDFANIVTSRAWIQQDLVQGGEQLLRQTEAILGLIAQSRTSPN